MAKLTLIDLANLNNAQAAVSAINLNNAAIEAAQEITLSRDGTQPNEMNANLDMNSHRILNLPEPVDDTEPVRKIDVSNILGGGNIPGGSGIGAYKEPVRVATSGPIVLSGLQTVDGIALNNNDRVLVKNQVNATQNGVYVAQTGTWLRALDFDSPPEVVKGSTILVLEGTFREVFFYLTSNNPIVIGTSALNFDQVDVTFDPLLARHVPDLNMFFGYAGNSSLTGGGNVAVGATAFINQTTGHNNVAVGLGSMRRSTEGAQNVAIGAASLGGGGISPFVGDFTGNQNTVVGAGAGALMTSGSFNVLIGEESGATLASTNSNTAVGTRSLKMNTGTENVAIGDSAMLNTSTAFNNVAMGKNALLGSVSVPLTGSSNVAIGYVAMQNAQDVCSNNVAIGSVALTDITTGTDNIAIGRGAGMGLKGGSGNTIIGSQISSLPENTNNTLILGVATNTIRLQFNPTGLLVLPSYAATDGVLEIAGGIVSVNPAGAGVSSIGGIAGDITLENTFTMSGQQLQLTTNMISNSKLTQAGAATIKGNPTAGLDEIQDFTIQGLDPIGSIDSINDRILIYDASANNFKRATPGEIAAAATAGVASLGGATGAIAIDADVFSIASGPTLTTQAITGVIDIAAGTATSTMGANKVNLSNIQQISTGTILGRITGTGDVQAINASNLTNVVPGANNSVLIFDPIGPVLRSATISNLFASNQGVTSITVSPNPAIKGEITFTAGTGMGITSSGNNITFTSSGGGSSGVTSLGSLTGIVTLGGTLFNSGTADGQLRTRGLTGAITSADNSFATTITADAVGNTHLTNMNPNTIKGNPSSSVANPSDFTIQSLAVNSTPNPTLDMILCYDASEAELRRMSIANLVLSEPRFLVNSVNGLEGAVTFAEGSGINIAVVPGTNGGTITLSATSGGSGTPAGVDTIGGKSGTVGLANGLNTTGNSIQVNPDWVKTTGTGNWYAGFAGNTNVNPAYNTAIGVDALANVNHVGAQNNIAIGRNVLNEVAETGDNVSIGNNSMRATRTPATAVLTMAAIPLNGETVSIAVNAANDLKTYVFQTTLTTPPAGTGHVKIGANVQACLTNLKNCINKSGGVLGTDYNVDIPHPIVGGPSISGATTMRVTSTTFDFAQNSFQVNESFSNPANKWDGFFLTDGGDAHQSIAIGTQALEVTSGSWNIGIGYTAGKSVTSSNQNVIIGKGAGFGLNDGIGNNVYIGYEAGFGSRAGDSPASYNIGIGSFALQWIGLGVQRDKGGTLPARTDGIQALENTAIGTTAGLSITSGARNTAIGANAMGGNLEVNSANTVVRGTPISANNSVAIGNQTLRCISSATGTVAVGAYAMYGKFAVDADLLVGDYNTVIGWEAFHKVTRSATRNVLIGTWAGHDLTNAADNIFIGTFAGMGITSPTVASIPPAPPEPPYVGANIIIGNYLNSTQTTGITTGTGNTIIGRFTNLGNLSDNVILGTQSSIAVLHYTGTALRFPTLSTPGLMTITDANGTVGVTAALTEDKGGTGQSTWNQGDIVYSNATNSLAGLAKSTATTVYLANTGTNNAPQWNFVSLATGVVDKLPITRLDTSGTASATTFLNGLGQWATPAGGGGGVTGPGTTVANRIAIYSDTTGNALGALTIGGTGTVLHGAASGIPAFSAVDLTADVTGQLPAASTEGWTGPVDTAKFWRHDGQWAVPPGGGGGGGDVTGPGTTVVGRLAYFSTTAGTSLDDITIGGTNTVLKGAASGPPTFGSVVLTSDVSGILPVGSGGTGITSGTQGGIPYFSASSTLASTSALTLRGPLLGGGTGAPTAMAAGTDGQLIIGQSGANPAWKGVTGAITINKDGLTTIVSPLSITQIDVTTLNVAGATNFNSGVSFNYSTNLNLTSSTPVWTTGLSNNPGATGFVHRHYFDSRASDSPFANFHAGEFYCYVPTSTTAAFTSQLFWGICNNGTFIENAMGLGTTTAGALDLTLYAGNLVIAGATKGVVVNGSGGVNAGSGGLTTSGSIKSSNATSGVGYATGAGGTVSIAGGGSGTLNKICGQVTITTPNCAAGAEVEVTVNNSAVLTTDVIVVSPRYASATGIPVCYVKAVTNGSFILGVTNVGSATITLDIIINFVVIKSVAA